VHERERGGGEGGMGAEFLFEISKSGGHVKDRPRYTLDDFIEMNCK
jgi:hypothetical protein